MAEKQTNQSSSQNPITSESNKYNVEEKRVSVTLDSNTQGLIAKVENNRIYFTLSGFLNEANNAGYSLVIDGVNNCERLVGLTLFKGAAEVWAQPTEITGDLIDRDGNPIQGRVIKLNDGRYAEPINHQSSCSSRSEFDGSNLQNKETEANSAIRRVIDNSLQSY